LKFVIIHFIKIKLRNAENFTTFFITKLKNDLGVKFTVKSEKIVHLKVYSIMFILQNTCNSPGNEADRNNFQEFLVLLRDSTEKNKLLLSASVSSTNIFIHSGLSKYLNY
jgi:hypothetical protein